jgi:hypothetical protein
MGSQVMGCTKKKKGESSQSATFDTEVGEDVTSEMTLSRNSRGRGTKSSPCSGPGRGNCGNVSP